MILIIDYFKRMTIDQIQVLQTIVKTGSFRGAAQNLHRAQSAISYAVKTLEEELKFELFDRKHYRPQLTPQGEIFNRQAADFLTHFEELQCAAKRLQLGHEPTITLSVSVLWPMSVLAKMLHDLKAQFPTTEIKILQDILSADELMTSHQVDVVFSELFTTNAPLQIKRLFDVTMIPLCSPHSSLGQLKGKAKEKNLRETPQIILRSTSPQSQRSVSILNPSNTVSVSDFLSKKELLLNGLGWGFMPEHLVSEELAKKKLVPTHEERLKIPMVIAKNLRRGSGPCSDFIWKYFAKK